MTRRLLTASAAAALVLGLAACGDDTGGTITDPPSTIATGASDDGGASDGGGTGASDGGGSTEASSESAPLDPSDYPEMDEHTEEGAKQAFQYFSDSILWGYKTGDTSSLESGSADNCKVCGQIIEFIEDEDAKDRHWSNYEAEVTLLDTTSHDDYEYQVNYGLAVGPHSEPDPDSDGTIDYESSSYGFSGGVNWEDGSWKVGDIGVTSDDV